MAEQGAAQTLEQVLREVGDAVFTGRIGERSLPEIRTGALRRASEIEQGAPRFRRTMSRELFALGVPALALYRTLRDDAGLDEAAAVSLVDDVLQASFRSRLAAPIKRRLMTGAFRLPVLRHVVVAIAERSREPGGFEMHRVVREPGVLLALDVERCPLAEFFARQGTPELGPLICKLDDVMVEAIDGVELRRTGTIAAGATRCDFRYRQRE